MGEYHLNYSAENSKSALQGLWAHINSVSNDVVSFVNDGNIAVWINATGTGTPPSQFWDGVTPLVAGDFGNGSYIVFEVNFANPGGRKWQCKIASPSSTSLSLTAEGAPNGGYSTGTHSFGSAVTTGAKTVCVLTANALNEIYISVCDLDTYDGGLKKYGYLRCLIKDGNVANHKGMYVGGYAPIDIANDTDPFLFMFGGPRCLAAGTGDTWGYLGASGSSYGGVAPVEDGLAVSSLVSAGYAGIHGNLGIQNQQLSKTRSNVEVEALVTVHQSTGRCLGYLGEYTMRGVSGAVGTLQPNNAGTRLALFDLAHRWASA